MSDGTSNPIAAKLRSTPKCRCMARSPSECCCQVDWPEHFIKKAADEIDRLAAALEVAQAAVAAAISKANWQARTNEELNRLLARIAELERPQEAREPFSERLKRNGAVQHTPHEPTEDLLKLIAHYANQIPEAGPIRSLLSNHERPVTKEGGV